MNAARHRRSSAQGKFDRRSQGRPRKRTLLVVCEGRETERNYLDGLKREDHVSRHFAVTVVRGRGGSRRQIVEFAVDQKRARKETFDEVWCIMDIEALATAEARNDLSAAIQIARDQQVNLCLSNPAFEVWLLAHFKRTSGHFNNGDAVIVELNKYWHPAFHMAYAKNDDQIYARVASLTTAAIQNAKIVREHDHAGRERFEDCNSATEMYRLVEYLTRE